MLDLSIHLSVAHSVYLPTLVTADKMLCKLNKAKLLRVRRGSNEKDLPSIWAGAVIQNPPKNAGKAKWNPLTNKAGYSGMHATKKVLSL